MFHSHVSLICYLSTPVCYHRLSRAIMDRHPKGSALLSWPAKSNLSPHSIVGTHSCMFHSSPQNPHYPVQAPPTSHLNWSDETPSYPNSGIKTSELTHLKATSPYTIQPFTLSHTPPHTLIYKCLNYLNHLFLPGQPTKRHRRYWAWMGHGMGGLLPWAFFHFFYEVLLQEKYYWSITPACILSRLPSLLKRLFAKWKSSLSSSVLWLLLFKVIKALLARSTILFVYLPAWRYETSVLRLLQRKNGRILAWC